MTKRLILGVLLAAVALSGLLAVWLLRGGGNDSEGPDAAWPYGTTLPTTPRQPWGNITYLMPDPASGIAVSFGAGDGPEGGGMFLEIRSDRSIRFIDAETGQIFVDSQGEAHDYVDERDREAFDRFTSSIELKD